MTKVKRASESARKKKVKNQRKKIENHRTNVKWSEETMLQAISACNTEPKMSMRAAAKHFEIPRATLQSRLNGKIQMGAKAGRKSLMSLNLEEKLLDYADNRARMGIGFGKEKFLEYAGKLADKDGFRFKNRKPSNKWWRLLNNRPSNKWWRLLNNRPSNKWWRLLNNRPSNKWWRLLNNRPSN